MYQRLRQLEAIGRPCWGIEHPHATQSDLDVGVDEGRQRGLVGVSGEQTAPQSQRIGEGPRRHSPTRLLCVLRDGRPQLYRQLAEIDEGVFVRQHKVQTVQFDHTLRHKPLSDPVARVGEGGVTLEGQIQALETELDEGEREGGGHSTYQEEGGNATFLRTTPNTQRRLEQQTACLGERGVVMQHGGDVAQQGIGHVGVFELSEEAEDGAGVGLDELRGRLEPRRLLGVLPPRLIRGDVEVIVEHAVHLGHAEPHQRLVHTRRHNLPASPRSLCLGLVDIAPGVEGANQIADRVETLAIRCSVDHLLECLGGQNLGVSL
mmetsp:Transcript_50854/g.119168  ORF Transcript_50854/g.119168 Transcript_50854/m.119168 type:complete len:319 (-) Transcript_50854:39-995(-)